MTFHRLGVRLPEPSRWSVSSDSAPSANDELVVTNERSIEASESSVTGAADWIEFPEPGMSGMP